MSSTNDVTGDVLRTKTSTEAFRKGYDGIAWSMPKTIAEMVAAENPTGVEIQEALEKLAILESSLKQVRNTLLEWDRVSKQMLYPHQHNTAQKNKAAIEILEQAINGIIR